MKKLLALSLGIMLVACAEEAPKDYVTLSGTISNQNSDSLMVRNRTFTKVIKVNADGTFKDTLKVEPGIYYLSDSKESTPVFLTNGYDLNMTIDTKEFDETVKYTGMGSENSNFLAEKALLQEQLLDKDFDGVDLEGLTAAFSEAKTKLSDFINSKTDLDTMVTNSSLSELEPMLKSYQSYYVGIIKLRQDLPKGSPSPIFDDYENYKGGTTSLADLKGKFVYVDVWATWCAPCKAEIPSLKKIEAEFHDKNIAFVSMSIDDANSHKGSWELANSDWKDMVADKELGGVQIFAPKGWQSEFVRNYQINGIPRFILIDPNGNIVDASAPRPSDPKLKEMLMELI